MKARILSKASQQLHLPAQWLPTQRSTSFRRPLITILQQNAHVSFYNHFPIAPLYQLLTLDERQ